MKIALWLKHLFDLNDLLSNTVQYFYDYLDFLCTMPTYLQTLSILNCPDRSGRDWLQSARSRLYQSIPSASIVNKICRPNTVLLSF
jgi:hypothetical protein